MNKPGTLWRSIKGSEMLDKNDILGDIKVGNFVRIRRTWRSPYAGRLGVVSAIELSDRYGIYMIEFEDGLQFRYNRHELEPIMARTFLQTQPRLGECLARFTRGANDVES